MDNTTYRFCKRSKGDFEMRCSDKPLHQAVWNSDINKIEYHLKENENINEKDENELRPLDIAIMTNNLKVVELLVSTKKSDITVDFMSFHYLACIRNDDMIPLLFSDQSFVQVRSSNGENLLHLAVAQGHEKLAYAVLISCLDHGYDINEPTKNGLTPLHLAVKYNHSSIFWYLVHDGKASIVKKSVDGRSVLHFAVQQDNEFIVKVLLGKGVDVNDTVISTGSSALHIAAGNNNLDIVNLLLINKANLMCRDNKGWNALHVAAHCGYTNLVRLLLDKGININSLTDDDSSPLLLAIENKKEDTIQMLFESGADINKMNKNGLNPLCASIKKQNHLLALQLLSSGARIQDLVGVNQSLLHISLEHRDLDFAKVLLQKKIRLNVRDQYGQNELHIAAQFGDADIVRTLLKRKMDVNELTVNKSTALHYSLNSKDITKLLINHGIKIDAENEDGDTALCIGAKTDCSTDAFEFLLISGANPNHIPKNKEMPLHTSIATSSGLSVPKAELLVKYGANLQRVNEKGDSCVHTILKYKKGCNYSVQGLIETFLRFGVDINSINQDNETLLITCLENFDDDVFRLIVELFVKKGAKMNKNAAGESPLHIAIRRKTFSTAEFFIEGGFDLESTTFDRSTPLHYAALYGGRRTIKSLLNAGLRVDATNLDWKTPLHLAVSRGSIEAIKELIKHDADVHSKDKNQNTALHLAVSRGNLEIVKFLIKKNAFTCDKNLQGYTVYDLAQQSENKHIYQCLLLS